MAAVRPSGQHLSLVVDAIDFDNQSIVFFMIELQNRVFKFNFNLICAVVVVLLSLDFKAPSLCLSSHSLGIVT